MVGVQLAYYTIACIIIKIAYSTGSNHTPGAPRAKREPCNSLNIEARYILIQRYKPHVLVFHLITQRPKHKKDFLKGQFHTE